MEDGLAKCLSHNAAQHDVASSAEKTPVALDIIHHYLLRKRSPTGLNARQIIWQQSRKSLGNHWRRQDSTGPSVVAALPLSHPRSPPAMRGGVRTSLQFSHIISKAAVRHRHNIPYSLRLQSSPLSSSTSAAGNMSQAPRPAARVSGQKQDVWYE